MDSKNKPKDAEAKVGASKEMAKKTATTTAQRSDQKKDSRSPAGKAPEGRAKNTR